MGSLFGLAPSGVYHRRDCCQSRGALLPHLFTLTRERAVSFLLHFPWAHAPQALPGALTRWSPDFPLSISDSDRLTDSRARLTVSLGRGKFRFARFYPLATDTDHAQVGL